MTSQAPAISVCSPVHNEEGNLRRLVQEIRAALEPAFGLDWEQLLVDDGSSDGSARLIRELAAQHHALRLVSHERNLGERAAWGTAFSHARGEIVVMLAADLQNDPRDIPALVRLITEEGFDCGTGARIARKDARFYRHATRVFTALCNAAYGLRVRDVSSSFFAVRRRLLEGLALVERDHRFILPILARRGASIREIPTAHRGRTAGSSHYTRAKVLAAVPEVARFTARLYRGFYDAPSAHAHAHAHAPTRGDA